MTAAEYDQEGNLVAWPCGGCGEQTSIRHFLQRDGVMAHDPEAAALEAAGLTEPEPTPPGANGAGP